MSASTTEPDDRSNVRRVLAAFPPLLYISSLDEYFNLARLVSVRPVYAPLPDRPRRPGEPEPAREIAAWILSFPGRNVRVGGEEGKALGILVRDNAVRFRAAPP